MKSMSRINFDPTFVEEAVFLLMKDKQADKGYVDFCHEKENIYQKDASNNERDNAFELFYERCFFNLGLGIFFENVCKDFPLLDKPEIRIIVKRVWGKKQEEAELYVRPQQKTVCLGILVRRVLDLSSLEAFLKHELMRVSDMFNPDFQYSPHPDLGGNNEMENNLIRERFRLLWDFYIDARLMGRNFRARQSFETHKKEFERKFFFLAMREREQIFAKICGCESLMQVDLLSWAGDPRSVKVLGEGGLRCPLCNFTSFDPIKHWGPEAPSVFNKIKKDYPHWEPDQGICPQCFDLYSLKTEVKV